MATSCQSMLASNGLGLPEMMTLHINLFTCFRTDTFYERLGRDEYNTHIHNPHVSSGWVSNSKTVCCAATVHSLHVHHVITIACRETLYLWTCQLKVIQLDG